MAITAKFEADFQDFKRGVTEAEAKLETLGASAGRAELKLVKMTGATSAGVAPANNIRLAYSQFDGALQSVGVHIGPQIKAIEDLQMATGKSAAGMSGMAKAGAAIGVGVAAWGITRAAMEFFELDKAVAQTWTSMLGWGNVAVEQAGAKADVLARASATAGREITRMAEAIAINEAEHKRWKGLMEAPAKLAAFEKSLAAVDAEAANLSTTQMDLIKRSLELGISTADIAAGMSLSKDAVEVYAGSLDKLAQFAKQAADSAERLAKLDAKSVQETADLWRDFGVEKIRQSGTVTDAQIAEINRWRDHEIGQLNSSTADYQKHKAAIVAVSKQQADAQMVDWDFLQTHSIEGLQNVADKAKATYDEMRFGARTFTREELEAQLQKVHETARAATGMGQAFDDAMTPPEGGWALMPTLDQIQAKSDALRKSFVAMGHVISNLDGSKGSDLGKSYARGLSEFDPSLVEMYRKMGFEDWQILNLLLGLAQVWDYQSTIDAKKSGSAGGAGGPLSAGGGGGSGSGGRLSAGGGAGVITVTVNQTVSGVFDPASKHAIAAAVKDEVLKGLKQAKQLGVG
jgi:hypothetical protein